MPTSYACANPARLQRLRSLVADGAPAAVNAIDHLVVVDGTGVPQRLRQKLLLVAFLAEIGVAGIRPAGVRIEGGVRIRDPRVRWAVQLTGLDPGTVDPLLTAPERAFLTSVQAAHAADANPGGWLAVMLEEYGDYSIYRFAVRDGAAVPAGFDPMLSTIEFSFKVECPSPFDCLDGRDCVAPPAIEPELDYLARDYPTFRRLMFDRLSLVSPADLSQDPAGLRTTLVEVLAYAADQAAYFQDAVATEAYLGTARTRPSVRRHARLLDYPMQDGCNARAVLQLQISAGISVSGSTLRPGAVFLTKLPAIGPVVAATDRPDALTLDPQAFETMSSPKVFSDAHNEIGIHTWADEDCCLPAGATEVWVVDDGRLELAEGDLLLLEQSRSPETLLTEDADPDQRYPVRLIEIGDATIDPLLDGATVRLLRWHDEDALPAALPLTVGSAPVALACGNLVSVDHGLRISGEPLQIRPWGQGLRATLARTDLAWACPPANALTSARALLHPEAATALPLITLRGEGETWFAVGDLLATAASGRAFVVEPESDGTTRLRFGDDVMGRRPTDLTGFTADYRIGYGPAGNVGAGSIAHLIADPGFVDAALSAAVRGIGNPLPAVGGTDPESIDDVKLCAPQAFRVQQRAVTEDDWVQAAERFPAVQRAVASRRWTGSWHTVYLTVDPLAGHEFDDIRDDLQLWLDPFRLAGYDLELLAPSYLPLDIVLTICVRQGYFRPDVERGLADEFSTRVLADGRLGFFHPDRFTFGDSVWLSQIVARAMAVPGVGWVESTPAPAGEPATNRFKRWGAPQGTEIEDGRIPVGDLQIARCDSNAAIPDHGRIAFLMEGTR